MADNIFIAAAGTGGHVFPALATALELRQRGYSIRWFGTEDKIESKVVPEHQFPLHTLKIQGVRSRGIKAKLLMPFYALMAICQVLKLIIEYRPKFVLCMGGYICGPVGIAAKLARVPLIIHEQNALPGKTNQILAKFATKVLTSFPNTFKQETVEQTGNPLRADFYNLPSVEQRFANRAGALKLLILGGSLGAKVMNEVVPQALAQLPPELRPTVVHQAGNNDLAQTQQRYNELGIEAVVVAFIDDMATAYANADLVIARSGALTVSELVSVGVGAVLVPYPYAVDDHQTKNAHFLEQAKAAELVQQSSFNADWLAQRVQFYTYNREQLFCMAQSARSLVQSNATISVVDICLKVSSCANNKSYA